MDELELAKDLMAVDTTSPVTETAVYNRIIEELEARGLEPEIHDENGVKNLVCSIGDGGSAVCLNGHLDVVAPGVGWSVTRPFEPVVEDGRLYGRGAADMKAGVAAQVAAFCDLADDDSFDGAVTLMLVGDEEQGGFNGTKPLSEELHGFDYVVVGEPTDLDVQVGTRGVLWANVTVHGEKAHASKPHLGSNPVEAMPEVLEALQSFSIDTEEDSPLPDPTAEVTVVETDDTQNSIPGAVHIGMDIRYTASQDVDAILARIRDELDALDVEYELSYTDHGGAFLLEDDRFREAAANAITGVTGSRPAFVTTGGASDGRFFSENGVPFIELGVEQDTVHQPDESCPVEDIRTLRSVYRTLVKDLVG